MNKHNLAWGIRILIFALFIVSALAKMFPVWAFEKQLVDLQLVSWCMAPFFSRFILGVELAVAFALLQPHFLKRIVIPATILLLAAFCVHLSIEMVKHGAMNGNCGCFGQLIPMTPLEAFAKNIVTIGLLVWLYRLTEEAPINHRFERLFLIWSFFTLAVFVYLPFCPCKTLEEQTVTQTVFEDEDSLATSESVEMIIPEKVTGDSVTVRDSVPAKPKGPVAVKSRFSSYAQSNGKTYNVDKDKYLVCFFAPGCDHCQEAAKQLAILSKKPDFPKTFIFFMDEEAEKIPEFFNIAGKKFPNRVLDAAAFWTLFGDTGETPGVFYLWNGNIQSFFYGTNEHAFSPKKLEAELKKAN